MKKIVNVLIILLATSLVLYFALKDDYETILNVMFSIDKRWLLIGFSLIMGYWFFQSIVLWKITKNFKESYRMRSAMKLILQTTFFNAVTPFATGGQPYQIYSLRKEKIKITDSTNISIECFIVYQIALVTLGLIAIISNYYYNFFPDNVVLERLVTLGFIINFFVIVALFLLTFTKKLSHIIMRIVVSILNKLKIVKNKEHTIEKFENYIREFHKGAKILLDKKGEFATMIFFELISFLCLYLVPFALICGVNITGVNPLVVIITSAYVMLIGSFVPIPGGTGGLEFGFLAFFGSIIVGSKLKAVMLLWRFITYYFGMMIGGILLMFRRKVKE